MLDRCETLMLDMDGTILDLAFDNYVWKQLVPERYAHANDMSVESARTELMARFRHVEGDLTWYCLDHWSERLGLDMLQLHRGVEHRIDYLPGARDFLASLHERNIRILLVTNSHPDTLDLKSGVTGLGEFFDAIYTSHEFGFAKERQEFWHALQEEEDFRCDSTLFVDDNAAVLRSAVAYGVGMQVEIRLPDTTEPRKPQSNFAGVDGVSELAP